MDDIRITNLKAYQKRLKSMIFTVTPHKSRQGEYRLRVGKKFILVDCPNKTIAENLRTAITNIFKNNSENIGILIDHIEKHAEQLTLELFPGEEKVVDGN